MIVRMVHALGALFPIELAIERPIRCERQRTSKQPRQH
jgi:hypothetical protein